MELFIGFIGFIGGFAAALVTGWVSLTRNARAQFAAPEEPEVTETDANRSLIEAIRTSITESPDNWIETDTGLKHISGTEVGGSGNVVWIEFRGRRSVVPESLSFALIRSVQIHNAREMLDGLKGEG